MKGDLFVWHACNFAALCGLRDSWNFRKMEESLEEVCEVMRFNASMGVC